MTMTADQLEPTDAAIDREIESLIGKQVRGEITEGDRELLVRLVARQSRSMRPDRVPDGRSYLRRAMAR